MKTALPEDTLISIQPISNIMKQISALQRIRLSAYMA